MDSLAKSSRVDWDDVDEDDEGGRKGKLERDESVPVEKEGYLAKKCGKLFLTSWKQRWFVLQETMLYYYGSEDAKKPLGVINLLGATIDDSSSGKAHSFDITTKRSKYQIYASSAAERSAWVEKIKKAIWSTGRDPSAGSSAKGKYDIDYNYEGSSW